MRRRLPWVLSLPLAFCGSWIAHSLGRALTAGTATGSEAADHIERVGRQAGATSLGAATLLAPFAGVVLVVLGARLWAMLRCKPWRGAGPVWFLILPLLAFLSSEVLERVVGGGTEALSLHAAREPGLVLALALQIPFGAVAYAIARLLLAAARAIITQASRSGREPRRPQQVVFAPAQRAIPARWSCLVGAHGLRGQIGRAHV